MIFSISSNVSRSFFPFIFQRRWEMANGNTNGGCEHLINNHMSSPPSAVMSLLVCGYCRRQYHSYLKFSKHLDWNPVSRFYPKTLTFANQQNNNDSLEKGHWSNFVENIFQIHTIYLHVRPPTLNIYIQQSSFSKMPWFQFQTKD